MTAMADCAASLVDSAGAIRETDASMVMDASDTTGGGIGAFGMDSAITASGVFQVINSGASGPFGSSKGGLLAGDGPVYVSPVELAIGSGSRPVLRQARTRP